MICEQLTITDITAKPKKPKRVMKSYNKTEKFFEARQERIKKFNLIPVNETYYNRFKESLSEKSWVTYKPSLGGFLEYINKDIVSVTVDEIENYCKTYGNYNNRRSHIRSLLQYIAKNNISGGANRMKRELLFWLI